MDKYHVEGTRCDQSYIMSRSRLREFWQSPATWVATTPDDTTNAGMDWGSLIDLLLLDEDRVETAVAVRPVTYPNKGEAKPWNNNARFCRWWNEKHADKLIVSQADMLAAIKAVNTIREHPTCEPLLDGAHFQALVTAEFAHVGVTVPVQTAIDIVPTADGYAGCIVDLKTTERLAVHSWRRLVFEHWYHVQAAMNLDLWNAATGESREQFRFIVQSSKEPYEITLRELSVEFIESGREQYRAALREYCGCLASGEWLGVDRREQAVDGWTLIEPLPWMVMDNPLRTADLGGGKPDWMEDE